MDGAMKAVPLFHERKGGREDPLGFIKTIDVAVDEKYAEKKAVAYIVE